MTGGVAIRRVERAADAPIDGLAELLVDVVDDGASVGFLAPLPQATATAYWHGVADALGDALVLWVAEIDGRVAGTVQLAPCTKDNGRHRADLQKLLVVRACRGRGIAAALLDAAEAFARAGSHTLLVLDTRAGSPAEGVYRRLGWQRVGEIPDYAADPDGTLMPTAYYYKRLS
jgi:acetyltransferase